jgi:hypothetical protein
MARNTELKHSKPSHSDKEAIELLRGATRELVPLPQLLHKNYEVNLQKSRSPLLRVALAFHNYRFLHEPWTLNEGDVGEVLSTIRKEIGNECAAIVAHLASTVDSSSTEEKKDSPVSKEPLLAAAYQLHGVTYSATSASERDRFFRAGTTALIDGGLLSRNSARAIVPKISTLIKARSPNSQTVLKSLQAIDVAFGKMDSAAIKRVSPILTTLRLYITRENPELSENLSKFTRLKRHILESNQVVDSREILFNSPEGMTALGRFLPYFFSRTNGTILPADLHLKAVILKLRHSLMAGNDDEANISLIEINNILETIQLSEDGKEQIRRELTNAVVSTLIKSRPNDNVKIGRMNISAIVEQCPSDYRLCCLQFLFDQKLPVSTKFTNFDKDVFLWVVSQLKLQQRQVFVETFYKTLSAPRRREILNSAVNYSIHDRRRGDALWRTFTGPIIRGEFGDTPILISTLTTDFLSSFSLAVLWAEYENDKFGRREVAPLPEDVLVSVSRGIANLQKSLSDLHEDLTGQILKRRWKAFLPVLYEENLLARVGQLAYSVSGALVDDVLVLLSEEVKKTELL